MCSPIRWRSALDDENGSLKHLISSIKRLKGKLPVTNYRGVAEGTICTFKETVLCSKSYFLLLY